MSCSLFFERFCLPPGAPKGELDNTSSLRGTVRSSVNVNFIVQIYILDKDDSLEGSITLGS